MPVVVIVVVVVGILQKTENVKESKTKRRRSLKKSNFLRPRQRQNVTFHVRAEEEKTKKKVSRTILAQSTASCMTSCFACFRWASEREKRVLVLLVVHQKRRFVFLRKSVCWFDFRKFCNDEMTRARTTFIRRCLLMTNLFHVRRLDGRFHLSSVAVAVLHFDVL